MSSEYCYVYLVRHGESRANLDGVNQGHLDSPLTKKGEEQAKELAEELDPVDFQAIYSSDLVRAKRTAEIIRSNRKLPIHTSESLRERSFGPLEGLKKEDYLKEVGVGLVRFNELSDKEKWAHRIHEEVETDNEVLNRFTLYLRGVVTSSRGGNILVVTHRGPTRLLLTKLGELSHGDVESGGALKNVGYVVLKFIDEKPSVEKVSGLLSEQEH